MCVTSLLVFMVVDRLLKLNLTIVKVKCLKCAGNTKLIKHSTVTIVRSVLFLLLICVYHKLST